LPNFFARVITITNFGLAYAKIKIKLPDLTQTDLPWLIIFPSHIDRGKYLSAHICHMGLYHYLIN
jgi:hypothetical protein